MKINFTFLKWIGLFLTAILIMIAIDPSVFNIPSSDRSWLFIANIVWLLMIASGIFSS